MRQTPVELNLGFVTPWPLDQIADLERPQGNESAIPLQGCELVEQLQRFLKVARDELCDAQDEQKAEASMSRRPIDSTTTASANVILDSKALQITYSNINPMRLKLVHHYIGPYQILRIHGECCQNRTPK